MNFGVSFFIGYRYWRAKKANAFASFLTLFAVSGIFLGVVALILVSSVMNGLEGQLKQRILGAIPQLTVINDAGFTQWQQDIAPIEALPQVLGASPTVTTQAMIQSVENIGAAQIYGIFPEQEARLAAKIGSVYSAAFESLEPNHYRIVLGVELARTLSVDVGDKIRLLSGDGVVYSPIGPVPSQRKFVVAGIFETGSQVDASVAYVHYQDARRLMRLESQSINEVRLYLTDPFLAPSLSRQAIELMATQGIEVRSRDWRADFGQLFAAVKMEKSMMALMLSLIVAVAAFNIVSALVMMVVDKTADVAVLKTQGLPTLGVMNIFIVQGSLNAILGLASGLLVGVILALNLNSILNLFGVSILGTGQSLPVALSAEQLGLIAVGTLVITLLATIYPAFTAARVQPASALRYE
ncbi:lipoprotein-releasing ABC transporter permease subunit [Shewanella sp. SR44-3]|uniref:lipoprotein-releasing ABC transporter permease subunit n=2 Tax=Shewanella TaxID=22 RepID=UPI0015FAC2DA|nr:lipoprotein-releasing ABC transporter permease subunit [Shewanella sp. SR44-3]MBB1267871.1 lipoprotein-releasing ABC transporter permease subunit [Shewanella sp. SR44-3]